MSEPIKEDNENTTFEQALAELDEIVAKLEGGDLPLEESLSVFQRGMGLTRFCSAKLDKVEKKLKALLEKDNGEFTLEDIE